MKNLFAITAILVAVSLIVFSCKKSSAPTTPTPVVPGGMFQVNNQFTDNTLAGGAKDSAGFAGVIPTGNVNIGIVTVNTFSLTFQSIAYFIVGNIAPIEGKAKWTVSGDNGFGSFTFTTSKNIPLLKDLHLTLSSFSRSTNLVLTHPTILADSIQYTITDDHHNTTIKAIANSSSGITFTPAMLTPLGISTNASIQILGYSSENSIQGGKIITFQNSCDYQKNGIAIN